MFFKNIQKIAQTTSSMRNEAQNVKGMRKQIFDVKKRLDGTHQYSAIFYSLINDVNHPPRYIEWTQGGVYWTESWEPQTNNYEPFSTEKYQNHNIGVIEACAIFLLIQDSYPNVYDFPTNTMAAIESGNAAYKLVMKDSFVGKRLIPAVTPQKIN